MCLEREARNGQREAIPNMWRPWELLQAPPHAQKRVSLTTNSPHTEMRKSRRCNFNDLSSEPYVADGRASALAQRIFRPAAPLAVAGLSAAMILAQ